MLLQKLKHSDPMALTLGDNWLRFCEQWRNNLILIPFYCYWEDTHLTSCAKLVLLLRWASSEYCLFSQEARLGAQALHTEPMQQTSMQSGKGIAKNSTTALHNTTEVLQTKLCDR